MELMIYVDDVQLIIGKGDFEAGKDLVPALEQ